MTAPLMIEWLDTLNGRIVARPFGAGADIFGSAGQLAEIKAKNAGEAAFCYPGCGPQHPARVFLLRRQDALVQELAA